MKLVFATNNRHKLEEISAIIGDKIEILGLNDIGCHDDIPETADTFEGNALLKARKDRKSVVIALPTTRDCKWRR